MTATNMLITSKQSSLLAPLPVNMSVNWERLTNSYSKEKCHVSIY